MVSIGRQMERNCLVSSPTSGGVGLLRVDLQGNARPLMGPERRRGHVGRPLTGRAHLAMPGNTQNSNIWMIENF